MKLIRKGEKMKEKNDFNCIEDKIKNRTNIVVLLVSTLFIVGILYKVIIFEWKVDPFTFSFSELLSFILTLFTLGISMAFYFKASETSNRFYENTYKFTKDISESIGRMEERFGERLKHMDEGYSKFLDHGFGSLTEIKKKEDEICEEKVEFQKTVEEKDKLINELIKKAKLSGEEKDNFLRRLAEREKDLAKMECNIAELETQLGSYKNKLGPENMVLEEAIIYIKQKISNDRFDYIARRPNKENHILFSEIIREAAPNSYIRLLRNKGFWGEDGLLSRSAYLYIRNGLFKE